MATKQPRIPAYRLHKPTGQAVVRIGGHDNYLGKHGTEESQEKYRRLIAEWLSSGVAPPNGPASSNGAAEVSVSELILAYWHFAEGYYRKGGEPTSQLGRIRSALRHLRRLYGSTPASTFGPLALKAVRQAMIEDDWSRNFINSCIGCVRRLFKWAVENEFVPPSLYHGLLAVPGLRRGRSKAKETEPIKPVPDELVDAVLPLVSPPVQAMVRLQRLTGMRPEEVTTIRGCEIDTSGSEWIYCPNSHKTEHYGLERVIYLGPRAQEILRPWLVKNPDDYLFSPRQAELERNARRRKHRASPMTPSQAKRRPKRNPKRPRRSHYDTDSYRRAVSLACAKAGVPHWHPNQLRHTRATELRKKYGIEGARVVLGQQSAEVTEIYAELDQTLAAKIMREVG